MTRSMRARSSFSLIRRARGVFLDHAAKVAAIALGLNAKLASPQQLRELGDVDSDACRASSGVSSLADDAEWSAPLRWTSCRLKLIAGLSEDGSHGQAPSHSIEFKRQIAQEFIAGETLHSLAKRHDVSRNLIRIWVKKLEAGAFDEDARAAHLRGALHHQPDGRQNVPVRPCHDRFCAIRSRTSYRTTSIGSKSAVEPHERVLKESQLQREAI